MYFIYLHRKKNYHKGVIELQVDYSQRDPQNGASQYRGRSIVFQIGILLSIDNMHLQNDS